MRPRRRARGGGRRRPGRPLGPLHGVPVAIKDLDDVAGVPTSMGSLAVHNRVPKTSAAAVERLIDAGAIVLGKTNTPEFGHKGITDNLRFGPTSTPWAIGCNCRRLVGRRRGCGRRRHGGSRAGHGRRRFGPHSRRLQRRRRLQGFLRPHSLGHAARRLPVGPSAGAHRPAGAHSRRRGADDLRSWRARMRGDPLSLPRRWHGLLARAPKAWLESFRSPTVRVSAISRSIRASPPSSRTPRRRSRRTALQSTRWNRTFGPHHRHPGAPLGALDLGALWRDRSSLEGRGRRSARRARGEADAPVPAMLNRRADNSRRSTTRSTTCCGRGCLTRLQDVFERYDVIMSPTLAIPPVLNATDGNTDRPDGDQRRSGSIRSSAGA